MRLLKYINEEISEETSVKMDDLVQLIKKNCKPFLSEFDIYDNPIYRGSNRNMADNIFMKVRSRKRRKPKDTPMFLHNILDDLFNKYFGWKARSEGIFVTHNRSMANNFGWSVLFFPKGKYEYIWNPDIEDLYGDIRSNITDLNPRIRGRLTRELKPVDVDDDFKEKLEEMVKGYKKTGFDDTTEHNEAMFRSYEYYIVDFDNRPDNKEFLKRLHDATK